eukprot:GHRQ01026613.1.p2 GENE.GHRQ01026613.1~~GHRQ01026613.1.p2  ORF type:complete len:103 (-),score=4.44 GHRQ01026613.1:477-785(-)
MLACVSDAHRGTSGGACVACVLGVTAPLPGAMLPAACVPAGEVQVRAPHQIYAGTHRMRSGSFCSGAPLRRCGVTRLLSACWAPLLCAVSSACTLGHTPTAW